jgi:uncharacterized protein
VKRSPERAIWRGVPISLLSIPRGKEIEDAAKNRGLPHGIIFRGQMLIRFVAAGPGGERKDAMYYEAMSQCMRLLGNIGTWLDKAEKHAAAKTFDVNILMTDRLAPDMKPFIYQVLSACDYVKGAAAWLSGQVPPKHEDNEQTIGDARARIRKTVAFAESVSEAQYAGASDRTVSLLSASGKQLGGKDYLLQIAIPNVYFHVAMAYAILRHNGVDIGKMDFLGPVNWIDA